MLQQRIWPWAILALLLCSTVNLSYGAQKPSAQELEQLRTRIQLLRDDLNTVRGVRRDVRVQLTDTERNIAVTVRQMRKTRQDLALNAQRLQDLIAQRRQLHASLARQREVLAEQVRTGYVVGRQDYMKMLLNQEQPARVGRVLTYYSYLDSARREQIESITQQMSRLKTVEDAINVENENLGSANARLASEKISLIALQRERRGILDRIDHDLNDKTQRLANLDADEQRLSELLRRLPAELADIPADVNVKGAFAKSKGKLPWPVSGRISAAYGTPRGAGNLRWQGVLLNAEEGAEVRAVWRGQVVFTGWLNGYGMMIIIDHGEGYMSLYAHNQSVIKEVGDWTEANEVIATVGDSGGQRQSGLYFEIRHSGKPDNPVQWCQRHIATARR